MIPPCPFLLPCAQSCSFSGLRHASTTPRENTQTIDCIFLSLFTCCAKWRRRCPRWLCCCCDCCCPGGRTSASGGRYSRVTTNGGEDGGEDSDGGFGDDDDDVDFGAREEEEDLVRLGAGRARGGKGGGRPPRRNGR